MEKRPRLVTDGTIPVSVLRLIEIEPDDFDRLYGEIATFMSGPGRALPGLTETQLFGSVDHTRIAILAQFRSRHDWVRAQWDSHLGELLEEIVTNSSAVDFNLYRGDRFSSEPMKKGIAHN